MRLLVNQAEAGFLVDATGRKQIALRPKDNFLIAGAASELDAFVDQGMAETKAARTGFDEQEAELGGLGLFGMFHEKDVARVLAVDFGDPAAFADGIEICDEIGDDFSEQGFEGRVETVFFAIRRAFSVHNPSHITRTGRAKTVRSVCHHQTV